MEEIAPSEVPPKMGLTTEGDGGPTTEDTENTEFPGGTPWKRTLLLQPTSIDVGCQAGFLPGSHPRWS